MSQLALVDLAGAERAQRTGNAGQALKEAGKLKIVHKPLKDHSEFFKPGLHLTCH